MHPEVQEENPGKCPKCGMKLVPIEKEVKHEGIDHSEMKHGDHTMKPISQMPAGRSFSSGRYWYRHWGRYRRGH